MKDQKYPHLINPNKAAKHQHIQRKLQNGFILLPVVMAITLVAAIAFLMSREGAMAVNALGGEMQSTQASMAAKAGMNHMLWQATNANCSGYTNLATTNLGNSSYSATITPTSNSPVSFKATGTDAGGATHTINRDRVTIYQPYKTVTLQLGTDPGKDALLSSLQANINFGGGGDNVTKSWFFFILAYANQLLQFDLPSAIPTTAHIVSAQLQMYQANGSGSGTISAHKLTRSWTEGTKNGSGTADGATWKTYDGTNAWTTNGGDYEATPVSTSEVTAGSDVLVSWEIAPLVQAWLADSNSNYGVLLKANDLLSHTFGSKEDSTISKRPKLLITWTCECGQACDASCDAEYSSVVKKSEFSTLSYSSSNIKGLTFLPAGNKFNGITADTGGAWVSVDSGLDKIIMTDSSGTFKTQVASPGVTPTGIAYIPSGSHAGQFAVTDFAYNGITWVNSTGAVVSTTVLSGVTNPVGVTFLEKTMTGSYDGTIAVIDNAKKISIFDQSGVSRKSFSISGFINQPEDLAHIPGKDRLLALDRAAQKAFIVDFNGKHIASYLLSSYGLASAYGIAINPKTCHHVFGDIGSDLVALLSKDSAKPANSMTQILDTVADTDIYEGTTGINYGTSIDIVAGRDNAGKQDKILIKFDLSGLPAGATLTSATLRLNLVGTSGTGTFNIGLYKIIKTWIETTATWSNFSSGGNYDSTQQAVTSVALGSTGFKEWAVPVVMVNGWIAAPSTNYGLALVFESSTKGPDYQFASKENTTVANRPQLVINYTMP